MNRRHLDVLIIAAIMFLPLLGILQACDSNGPIAPGSPGDKPPPDNRAPVAVFSVVSPEEGVPPLTVRLDGSMSFDPNGDPMTFTWLFSDGGTEEGPVVEHRFETSGRHEARLVVTDRWGLAGDEGPAVFLCYGLANSPWPKFAHDQRNSSLAEYPGPMMDLEHADEGHAFPRYWRGGINNAPVNAVCIGYDGMVIYTQGSWLRARTAYGDTLWDRDLGSDIGTWPAIAYDGSIICATEPGLVYRISSANQIMWTLDLGAIVGDQFMIKSAVSIDSRPCIYIGGVYDRLVDSYYMDTGILFAISLDGNLLWQSEMTAMDSINRDAPIIPAIAADGEIIVNGKTGYVFSPDGELLRTLDFFATSYKELQPVGPPSVSDEGIIAFTHGRMPIFSEEGELISELTADLVAWEEWASDWAGYIQAPCWGPSTVSQVMLGKVGNDPDLIIVSEGGFRQIIHLISQYEWGMSAMYGGVAQDSLGRLYVSSRGIRAFSPISTSSVFPYVPRRFSLWSYERRVYDITAPVIGDERWLYLGYGDDIMALGD